MGSYTFRWDHSAEEVYVTGTFDNWQKSVRLDKTFYGFERDVHLPDASQKILYKFVADGVWQHDHTGKTETDHEGNVNNVLYPEDIKPPNSMAYQFNNSSVAPGATTTELAGQQPLEKQTSTSTSMPGDFPETPAIDDAEGSEDKGGLSGATTGLAAGATAVVASAAAAVGLSSGKNKENVKEQRFSVNPIPASAGAGNPIQLAPGQKVPEPSTINNNTVSSTARDDPSLKALASEQTFGVSPIPATGGIGNPVHLQPGEKVPDSSSLTGNTINSNVKLDEASYEKSGSGAPQLPPVVSPACEGSSLGGAALFSGLGPQTSNMIPESSMGMGKDAPPPIDRAFSQEDSAGPAFSSAAPASTTAALAGQVPKEPRGVPEVVTDSQKEAHVSPEAAANPEAVLEKKQMENELKKTVPEEPAAKSETNSGAIAGGLVGGAAAAGLGAAAISSVAPTSTTNELAGRVPEEPRGVPEVVTESQEKAHVGPEAAANPEAVQDKTEMESELKAKVPEEPASTSDNKGVTGAIVGGLAAAGAAAAGGAAYLAHKTHETTGTDPTTILPASIQQKINEQNAQVGTSTASPAATSVTSAPTSGAYAGIASLVPAQKAVGEGVTPLSNGTGVKTADAVPAEVQASQKEAHVGPEAAANPEAVHEKSDVEKELLKKVPESQATGEPAPTFVAATIAVAPTTTSGNTSSGAPQLGAVSSIAPISMDEKPKDALNASASSQAQAPASLQASKPLDSRDVSPMSRPNATIAGQNRPIVTTGIGSSEAPMLSGQDQEMATAAAHTAVSKPVGTPRTPQANPSTPQKRNSIMGRFGKSTPNSSQGTPDSTGEGSAKKKGLFTRIKEKLKN
ncbi:carbohydrate-binding module family 48 protein [Dothistroma septosporum NZE10]|uniref:Carbohydrate-binding module family 48 protein n=1 Tax=Dothistroma septosporum (strain NZE10 / CBS 128990) TaxID=675120 RepID=N1PSR1_DOTSN|nr:carbohydrate-binding module family 48 protein [Dothistroma septosporum NZE10]